MLHAASVVRLAGVAGVSVDGIENVLSLLDEMNG